MTKTNFQLWVLLLLAVVHTHGGANAFSTLAPPAPRTTTNKQQAQDVARTFKITWELDVEERIRRSLDDHRTDQMPYLVAVAGIPGR